MSPDRSDVTLFPEVGHCLQSHWVTAILVPKDIWVGTQVAFLWCWTNFREILIFPKHKHWSVSDKQSLSWQKHRVSATVCLGCGGRTWVEPSTASGGAMSSTWTSTFPLVLLSILGPRCFGPYDLHFQKARGCCMMYHEAWKERQLFSVTPKGFPNS